jgi:HK97 family phage prohead protease
MKPNIPNLPERESRFLAAKIELRAAAEGEEPKKVFGYAAKFNSESEILEKRGMQFVEVIEKGAFDGVLNNDVRALFNHNSNLVLARSKNGTGSLQIGVDDAGLWYEFEAPDTQLGRDLLTSIRRGDIDSSSFGFVVGKDRFEKRNDGKIQRVISSVSELLDVSPVTYPAYPEATVAFRALEQFRNQEPETPENEPETPSQEEISEVSDWAARLGLPPAH